MNRINRLVAILTTLQLKKFVTASILAVIFILISCEQNKNKTALSDNTSISNNEDKQRTATDTVEIVEGAQVRMTIDSIMSTKWIEISKKENDEWVIIPQCDAGIPTMQIFHDTLYFELGDGGVSLYKVMSTRKLKDKKFTWNLRVMQLYEDPPLKPDTLTITVTMIKEDISNWRIGNDNNYNFVNERLMSNYPKEIIDCSGFDKEYGK